MSLDKKWNVPIGGDVSQWRGQGCLLPNSARQGSAQSHFLTHSSPGKVRHVQHSAPQTAMLAIPSLKGLLIDSVILAFSKWPNKIVGSRSILSPVLKGIEKQHQCPSALVRGSKEYHFSHAKYAWDRFWMIWLSHVSSLPAKSLV